MLTNEKIQQYNTNGWTLGKLSLGILQKIILNKPKNKIRIIEFGSGLSTTFLVDLNKELLNKELEITSFDNDVRFSYDNKEQEVNLCIRNLVECTDENYQKMLKNKSYSSDAMYPKKSPLTTRQKNNFYDVQENDIVGDYDLMILDGPNGNGRNIAFLHMMGHLKPGSHVFIDDHSHYDFKETFLKLFKAEQLYINDEECIVLYKLI